MTEAEANRLQTDLCLAEVARIHAAGERYFNAKLIGAEPVRPSVDALASIEPYAGSVKQNVRLLLQDCRPRSAREIASSLNVPVDYIYTAIGRLRNDGWDIETIGTASDSLYQWASVVRDSEPRGIAGWYRTLLSDAREHGIDEFLSLGGSREDLWRRIWELRKGGMNIACIRRPGRQTAYQWRP